jgi:predicted small metal-binding protein
LNYALDEIDEVVKKVFEYMRDVNCKGRRILEGFMDKIKNIYKAKHITPIRRTRTVIPPPNVFNDIYNKHLIVKCNEIINQSPVPKKLGKNTIAYF